MLKTLNATPPLMSNSPCLSGPTAKRILELADPLGLSPEDYVNALLERAVPRRRVDLTQ
jgi:hypothetical protein